MTDLTALRVGDRVQLQWTAPARTTDGLDLTTPTTVEICRDLATPPSVPPAPGVADPSVRCTPVMTLAGHQGASTVTDLLMPPLTNPAADRSLMAYRIRTMNPAGRSAAPSSPVFVLAGPALLTMSGFRAQQTRAGVVLEWPKANPATIEPDTTVEVLRTTQTPNAPGQEHSVGKPSKKVRPDPLSRTQRKNETADLRLRQPAPSSASQPEPSAAQPFDGMIDRSATQGMVYTYSAQRVKVVAAAGKTIEIRSEPTPSTTIAMRDTFPPAPPQGLVSVPGTTAGQPGRTGTVDLAWEPNTETDLAGYFVYRTDLTEAVPPAAKPTQLNPSPISASTYRDESALPGHRYAYRIAAVDRNGNVSAFSLPAEDSPGVR